ncbi:MULTISPECIES: 3-deoxy-7-phosphoheptulonate synthase [Corallincola]|uniref:Phospho-2-dehydro-3-deoxyheptonate aldolase n=3 Tax=Corallincola TaxID=1775176 RepID=A0A368NP65_9GAMM|nr:MULTISPECIES: 3-deoxy-7-phosphoheptulonate synthase [Corallincola]RCU51900.1 3-deoxy-7-phosphoheptulonate synthase [Corallincola holothuriorum]TAA47391.1 3-deoxy-7-phosphoheptulonate synthase [Corallincola spongiicola]TCI05064.1 3-deoxy-7-phosphoheptulonate synthase [Corallincola luteus]
MHNDTVNDVHVSAQEVLITPKQLKQAIPASDEVLQSVADARNVISNIIHRKDPRLLVVTGPCSIHDVEAAKEYALKLKKLHDELKDELFLVMRVYFEKPRTTVGWKGLINDPNMDGTFALEEGLHKARELLLWIAELGLPMATEALDPISPQYLSELFSWAAIGARTTESQTHREMASGLSMPVGFKNGTDGNLGHSVNAMKAAASGHRFMGINGDGQVSVIQTEGNPDGHVILRGGKQPNYDSVNVAQCEQAMTDAGLSPSLVVDCSHGNSNKDYSVQPLVAENIMHQILDGNRSIIGIMLESHLNEGAQSADLPRDQLKYGVSVTDACINWETTETSLRGMAEQLSKPLKARVQG